MTGNLEGLESGWDSPGLGKREVEFYSFPVVDQCFYHNHGRTSWVESVKQLPDGKIGFRTVNTTYILELDE